MTSPNQDQADFWNGETALTWVRLDAQQGRAFRGVTEALIEAARLRPGMRVLDIGCGTGDTAVPVARATGAPVTGVDISEPMIARAKARLAEAGDLPVTYLLGDAQTEVFEAEAFDRILSRFGMMFFADPVAAFGNLSAALKPGGEMHFACWGPPPANPWFSLPGRLVAEHFGPGPAMEPNAPGPFGFADADWVLGLMRAAGLKDPACRVLDMGLDAGQSVADGLEYAALGPIGGAIRERGGTDRDFAAICARYATELEAFLTPEGLRIPARLNFFRAAR